jgi:hypothetical protein
VTGFLSFDDFRAGLEELGLSLGLEDALELAFKYKSPIDEGEEGGIAVDYSAFARFLFEAMRKGDGEGSSGEETDEEGKADDDASAFSFKRPRRESRRSRSAHPSSIAITTSNGFDVGFGLEIRPEEGPEVRGQSDPLDDDRHEVVVRAMKDALYRQPDKRQWLRALRRAFWKADALGKGALEQRALLKTLQAAGLPLDDGDLIQGLTSLLQTSRSGQLAYPRLLRLWARVLDCPKEEARDLASRLMARVAKTPATRLRWLRRLRRRLIDLDKYRTGVLDMLEVVNTLEEGDGMQVLQKAQLKDMAEAFLTEDRDGVAYRPLLRTLAQVRMRSL